MLATKALFSFGWGTRIMTVIFSLIARLGGGGNSVGMILWEPGDERVVCGCVAAIIGGIIKLG